MEYERLQRNGRERYLDRAVLAGRGYIRHGLLGKGSFSDVYCIEDRADGRRYACKISWRTEMLEREAQVLKGLRHPLYPEFAAFWRTAGLGILLREYVEGHSLEEMLKRRHFSAGQTAQVGLWLAEGLLYLHALPERLLFRDVKPANIIVRQDGRVKLIDFGCVCPMGASVASRAGSPGFAAPEQLGGGGTLTEACDVYGLGRTLEAMLAGGRGLGDPGGGQLRERSRGSVPGFRRSSGTSLPGGRMGRLLQAGKGRMGPCAERGRRTGELRLYRNLQKVLRACTEEEAGKRIADMEKVMERLRLLSAGQP